MDNNKKRNLDAVSRIDENVLEKQTKRRIELLSAIKKGFGKKRWIITIGSAAASLALIFTTVFVLINLLGKTVPVYTGMTVSGAPGDSTTLQIEEAYVPSYADPGDDNGLHKGHYKGDCKDDQTPPADEPFQTPIEDTLSVIGAEKERYYAKPYEDIYITVHIDNPDSFEILSFTLNGEKYSSYMFEQGSDLENLILKVNVGNAEGVVDYTIDAIKYVDGEKIKDVKMEGDQTVEVGIYTEKQPVTTVTSEQIGFNSVSFSVSTEDAMGLVGDSAGKLEAVIYDGEQIVARKEIAITGASEVQFDGLETNKVYQYAVLATYDALDGAGMNTYVLLKKSFSTRPVVLFDSITLSTTGVQFALSWDGDAAAKSLTALTLYQGESKVRDLAADAISVDGLRANTAYVLVADYQNGGKTEQIKLDFTTDPLVYTVNYLLENLAGDGYEQIATSSTVVEQDAVFAPALNSYEGFTSPTAVQKIARADDDSFVVNYQYTRNTYMLTLKNSGTSGSQLLKYGAPLEAVSKPDFDFVGWFNANGAKITHMPASALTVFATWAGEATANDLYFNITETDLKITVTGLKNRDLTELHIPAYLSGMPVVGIGARAFLDQTRLVKVTVPDTVTAIGEAAFNGCAALREITVPFVGDCIKTADELYQYPFGYIFGTDAYIGGTETAQIYLADSLTSAVTSTYYIPTTLTTVTVTGGNILRGAFYGCGTLTAVKLPDSCTEIGSSAFWDCQALQSCTLPTKLQKLGHSAFVRCYALSSISLPTTLKEIGTSTFTSCKALQAITLPNGLQSIGNAAFSGCIALETLHIPASVSSIGTPLFVDCVALEQLTVASENTHFRMANGCLVDIAAKKIIGALKNATIPADESVTIIGMGTFQFANWLTELTIPANIEQIEQHAFMACQNLQFLQFTPNGALTTIGSGSFNGCDLLSEISVPDTVTSIGQSAFHCKGLTAISLPFVGAKPVTAPDANQYPLGHIFSGASSTIPEGFVKVSQIYRTTSSTGYSTRHYLFPAGLKTVSVGGSYLPMGTFYNCSMLESITLTGEVTDIDASAFFNCKGITTISLPTSLKTLGNHVFRNCEKLEALTIPTGVTSIGTSVLMGCTSLETLTIPFVGDSVKTATDEKQYPFGYLFGSTSDITGTQAVRQYYISTGTTVANTTYYIPTTLKSVTVTGGNILQGAFYGCTMLESVTLSQALTEIGDKAFCNCTALESVNLSGIAAIGINAFQNCTALDSVDLSGITTIGANAFQNCTALSAITLPATLTSMGANAFYGCSGLSAIDYNVPALTLANGLSPFRACGTETEGFTAHIGANVIAIPAGLFNGGNANTAVKLKSVVFAENAACQSIGGGAFQYCTALESVTLPEGLTNIGASAFNGCSRLSTIYYNAKNATVGSDAFTDCGTATSAVTLNIGAKVSTLNTEAFHSISKLQAVSADPTNTSFYTENNILYNKAKTSLLLVPLCIAGDIVLADGLTEIGTDAFKNRTGLTGITVPNSVTSIAKGAFYGCTALESISLPFVGVSPNAEGPDSVFGAIFGYTSMFWSSPDPIEGTSYDFVNLKPEHVYDWAEIPDGAVWQYSNKVTLDIYSHFYNIPRSLESVTVAGGGALPAAAFNGCDFIAEINLNDSITAIGAYAFQNCASLTELELPNSISSIGEGAFSNCGITSFELPAGVTSFNVNILQGCNALTALTVDSGNTVYRAINNALVELSTKKLIFLLDGASIPTDGTLVTTIGAYLFDGNTTLQSLTIPENITVIEAYAFRNCTALKSVTLPSGLSTISRYLFAGCTALESIALPDNITQIQQYAFSDCTALIRVTASANSKLANVGEYAFQKCASLASVMMPANVSLGNAAFNGTRVLETYGISMSNTLVHHADFTEPSKVFVDENGYVFVVDGTNCYLIGYVGDQTELTLPASYNGLNYVIYDYAFFGKYELTKVVLPEGISSIGDYAFYNCSSLTDISIPNSVSSIGFNAFSGDRSGIPALETVDEIAYLGKWAIFTTNTSRETPYIIREGTVGVAAGFDPDAIDNFSFIIPTSVQYIGERFCAPANDGMKRNIYYRGTSEQWQEIIKHPNWAVIPITNTIYTPAIYYYSPTAPSVAGNYWYQDVDDSVQIW